MGFTTAEIPVRYETGEADATERPPLVASLDRVDQELGRLGMLVESMYARLNPILRPSGPVSPIETTSYVDDDVVRSDLTGTVDNLRTKADHIGDLILGILHRLDL